MAPNSPFPATADDIVGELLKPGNWEQLQRRLLISGDERAAVQMATTIINAATIGTINLAVEEEALRNAVQQVQQAIATDSSLRALQAYFRALRGLDESAYRTLGVDFGARRMGEVYVPLHLLYRDDAAKVQTVTLPEAVGMQQQAGQPILLVGDPGSGKSTLLRNLAMQAWEQPERVGLNCPHLPLLVRLQCLGEVSGLSLGQRLWQAVERAQDVRSEDAASPPSDFLHAWSRQMQAPWLLLLDGWDELHPRYHLEVGAWLRTLLRPNDDPAALPRRLLITTRPTSSFPADVAGGCLRFHLASLDETQQQQLATRWLAEEATPFLNWLTSVRVGELVGTPLILTLAAFVYRHAAPTAGELPVRRVDLYRDFLQKWFDEAWERGAEAQVSAELRPHVELVLEEVAHYMTTQPEMDVAGLADLVPVVAQALAPLLGQPEAGLAALGSARQPGPARQLLQTLGVRSGVFTCVNEVCAWQHPTFREYLTARALHRRLQTQAGPWPLDCPWQQDRWRQVGLLLLALQSETAAVDPLLLTLLPQELPHSALYVGQAIAEGTIVSPATDAQVLAALVDIACEGATDNICNQLLKRVDQVYSSRAQELLVPRLQEDVMHELLPKLQRCFLQAAYDLNNDNHTAQDVRTSAVCPDMARLQLWDELRTLFTDCALRPLLRVMALQKLPAQDVAAGGPPLLDLLSQREEEYDRWEEELADALRDRLTEEALHQLATDWPSLTGYTRRNLPLATRSLTLLDTWLGDQTLAADLRLAAASRRLYLGRDEEGQVAPELLEQLLPVVRALVNTALTQQALSDADDPVDPFDWRYTADLPQWSGPLGEAGCVAELTGLLRLPAPDSWLRFELRQQLVAQLIQLQEYSQLIEVLEQAAASEGDWVNHVAEQLAQADLTDPLNAPAARRLLGLLQAQLASQPGQPLLLQARARVQLALGAPEEARPDLDSLADSLECVKWALAVRGELHRQNQDYWQAKRDLLAALAISPDDAECRLRLADAYYHLEEYTNAIEESEKEQDYQLVLFHALDVHVDSLRKIGELQKASAQAKKWESRWDEESGYWVTRAACELDMRPDAELAGAAAYLERAALQADNQRVWYWQAILAQRRGDLVQALTLLDKLLTANPTNYFWRNQRARLLLQAGAVAPATADIEQLRQEATGAVGHGELELRYTEALLAFANWEPAAGRQHLQEAMQVLLPWAEATYQQLPGSEQPDHVVARDAATNFQEAAGNRLHLLALCAAALADAGRANWALAGLRETCPDCLFRLTLCGLRNLAAFPNQLVAQRLASELHQQLAGPAAGPVPPPPANVPLPHQPYECPMYCGLAYIAGLQAEKQQAEPILAAYRHEPSIVVLRIEAGGQDVYGHTNFKREASEPANLKFSDQISTILERNLRILVRDYHVVNLLFLEEELRDQFMAKAAEQGLPVRCRLLRAVRH